MSYLCNSFEDVCDFVIAVNLFMYIDNAILIKYICVIKRIQINHLL